MKRFLKPVVAMLVAVALTVALSACGSSSSSPKQTGGGDGEVKVVFSDISETATLDPAVTYAVEGFLFTRNVYEGLLEYEPGTLNLRPLLATEWEASSDGLEYTFTLRDDVEFHDGTPFTAEAAKLSIERIQAINQGPATLTTNIRSISAPSPTELVVSLKSPDAYFLGTLPKLGIVSAEALKANRTADDEWAADWFTTNSAGTGPYTLAGWKRNSAIYLEKFDSYWREFEPGTPTNVTLRVDPDVGTALQLMGQGEIDMIGAIGPDDTVNAESIPGLKIVEQPALQVQVVPLNISKGPLKDPKVREAVVRAFDYDGLIEFYSGYAVAANGPLPTDLNTQGEDVEPATQDLEEAKRLLAEAGYPGGGFTLEYLGLKGLAYEEFTGTLLEDNLGKLGIKVKQTLVPWPQMVEIQSKPSTAHDMSFLNQSPLTDNAAYMLASCCTSENIASEGGYNWSYLEDPELDRKIAAISAIASEEERMQAVADVNREIVDRNIAIYVAQPTLAQPVREDWDVVYEPVDGTFTVRFFYARKQ